MATMRLRTTLGQDPIQDSHQLLHHLILQKEVFQKEFQENVAIECLLPS